jgi:excisionase family DNA binding protein
MLLILAHSPILLPSIDPILLMIEDVYTPNQTAEILGIAPQTVYRYIREQKLSVCRIGRLIRIPESAIRTILNQEEP